MSITHVREGFPLSIFKCQLEQALLKNHAMGHSWDVLEKWGAIYSTISERLDEDQDFVRGISVDLMKRIELVSWILKVDHRLNSEHVPDLTKRLALIELTRGEEEKLNLKFTLGDIATFVDHNYRRTGEISVSFSEGEVICRYKKYISTDEAYNKAAYDAEYQYLNKFNHPNIIKLLMGVDGIMFMELAPKGSLRSDSLPDNLCQVLKGVVRGLQYLHNLGFVHRDITQDSILLSEDGEAKIADLEVVTDIKKKPLMQSTDSKYYHYPPELRSSVVGSALLEFAPYSSEEDNTKIDAWALGVLIGELLMMKAENIKYPFKFDCSKQFAGFQLEDLEDSFDKMKLEKHDPHGILRQLMLQCLHSSWKERPSMETALTMFTKVSEV